MKNNESALEMCLRMLRERAEYWYKNSDDEYEIGVSEGYDSAATILEYAMQNNIKVLSQLDFIINYHKEEEHE